MKKINFTFSLLLFAQFMLLLGCKQEKEKEVIPDLNLVSDSPIEIDSQKGQVNQSGQSLSNSASPSLLFTEQELSELKTALGTASGSLKKAYDTLMVLSNNSILYKANPYTGDDSMEFYMNLKEPAGLARDLALAYALTDEEDNEKYALKAIEMMEVWAEDCNGISYERYAGTSMLIVRSLFPMLCAYDILKDEDVMEAESRETIEAWFRWLAPQVRAGVSHWEENDYFQQQDYQNHLASHTLGLLSLGIVLEDEELYQFGLDSPENPRDLYELIEGSILMEGDTPHHREVQAPPPADGEIYDRYRHDTNPLKGLGYAHLTLSQLALSANIVENNGIDMFSYVAPGGENLLLSFEYYSDFYRLNDTCIKSNYYCGETIKTDSGMFEIGFAYYPDSQPLKDLINSGAYDRGTSYNDLLGLTRFYPFSVDQ